MRVTRRDFYVTALFAAIVIPYIGYLVNGDMPFIQDARGMAAAATILGLIAWAVERDVRFRTHRLALVESVLAVATLGLGVTTVGTGNGVLLAVFMAALTLLWMSVTLLHAPQTHFVSRR